MFNRILVCLDGSDFAESILPYVIEQAKKFDSKVFLLRVNSAFSSLITYSAVPGPISGGVSVALALPLEEQYYHTYLEEIAGKLINKGLNVEVIIQTGTITDIILKCIRDNVIDLVAMASHTYKGWKRLTSGSITEEVLRRCNIPALVINPCEEKGYQQVEK